MALIESPTAADIYSASKLSPRHFETDTEVEAAVELDAADIIAMIEAEILEDVQGEVNLAVDEAAAPFDYPFSAETLATIYPTKSVDSNTEWTTTQNGRLKRVVLWLSLAELYSRVNSLDEAYDKKAAMYKKWGEDKLKAAVDAIKATSLTGGAGLDEEVALESDVEVMVFAPMRRPWG